MVFIDYNLGAGFTRLTGEVGIDDRHRGDNFLVDFFILLDDELVFHEKDTQPGNLPVSFDINVTNGVHLKLKAVVSSGNYHKMINWRNVILYR